MTDKLAKTGDSLNALILGAESKLKQVAPQWLSVERLTRLALLARSRNPALAECTADSFLSFCMRCAETGLEPVGAGGAWPVPYRNKNGTREVQFIPDWRGLIWLAKQSNMIRHAYGAVVKENDTFSIEQGDTPKCTHIPALKNRGETIGAYCVVILPDGSKHVEWMNSEELDAIRGRSKAKDSGPWVTDRDAMYIKTVVKRGLKPFAGSPQLHTAIEYDDEVTGLKHVEGRSRVSMPVRREESTEEVVETEAEQIPDAQDSEQEHSQDKADGILTVSGKVEAVSEKSGTGKNGKEWTRYGIKIDGKFYNTFSETVANSCRDAQENAEEVTLSYAVNSKGYNDIIDVM